MGYKPKRREFLVGVGTAGIASVAGCLGGNGSGGNGGNGGGNGNGGNGGVEGRTVKMGAIMALSGNLADLGVLIRDAAILPQKQLKGKTAFTFDIQVEDGATKASQGISAANTLINAGYPSINGPLSSGVNIPVCKQVLIPTQTVGCSPSSTSPKVTTLSDNDYIFRTAPSDALQGQVLAQLASKRVNAKSASTLALNNDYGQALAQSFVSAYKGEVTSQVSFGPNQASYTAKISEALSGDPEAMLLVAYPGAGTKILRDFYSGFDTDIPILVTDGLRDTNLQTEVGFRLDNLVGTSPATSGPGRKAFTKMYKEAYGRKPGAFNAHSYDATAVLFLANIAGGKNSGTTVQKNMRTVANPKGENFGPDTLIDAVKAVAAGDEINYQGASSSVNFDEKGDMKTVSYDIYKFAKDGSIKIVDTITFGASKTMAEPAKTNP
jgi:ABC-type branched-subunit amino acid transport system substrate-binding protein